MAHDVFLSHSVKDKAVADAIVARLEAESVTCWIAPRDVVPGARWAESIINAIESSRVMILVFSKSANASPQIEREIERAVNKQVYIIPFRVDDIAPSKNLEYFISTAQWIDAFSLPLERHLGNLTKAIKAVLANVSLPTRVDVEPPVNPPPPEPVSIDAPVTPVRRTGLPDESSAHISSRSRSLPLYKNKVLMAIIAIGFFLTLVVAAWYLGQKRDVPRKKASELAFYNRNNTIMSNVWPTEPKILCITTGDTGYGKLHERGLRAALERTQIDVVTVYEYLEKSSDVSPYDKGDLKRIKVSINEQIKSGQIIGVVGPCMLEITADIVETVLDQVPSLPIILESPVTRSELGYETGRPYDKLKPPFPVYRISSGIDERIAHLSRLILFLIQDKARVTILLEDTPYAHRLLDGVKATFNDRSDIPKGKLRTIRLPRDADLEEAKAFFASADFLFYFGTGARYIEIAKARMNGDTRCFFVGLMNAWAFDGVNANSGILPRLVDLEDIQALGAAKPRTTAQLTFESRFGGIGPAVRDEVFSFDAGLCLSRAWEDARHNRQQKSTYGDCLSLIRKYLERRGGHECVGGKVEFPEDGGQNIHLQTSFVLSRAVSTGESLKWVAMDEEALVREWKTFEASKEQGADGEGR